MRGDRDRDERKISCPERSPEAPCLDLSHPVGRNRCCGSRPITERRRRCSGNAERGGGARLSGGKGLPHRHVGGMHQPGVFAAQNGVRSANGARRRRSLSFFVGHLRRDRLHLYCSMPPLAANGGALQLAGPRSSEKASLAAPSRHRHRQSMRPQPMSKASTDDSCA